MTNLVAGLFFLIISVTVAVLTVSDKKRKKYLEEKRKEIIRERNKRLSSKANRKEKILEEE